ncbi:hypothetical protein [Arthrobacter gengyunqii]|uniref:Uncharacterized protein n=1 Tax=Arthrobacter gengyunqii TaxID=2886940 RepID=A0ABS8GIK8_9MICC|nr:hypothetical protein [Arthrobacter gengyunqii]MCC3266489.1 hypothetical protein [Arthrobacter gengyunqii]
MPAKPVPVERHCSTLVEALKMAVHDVAEEATLIDVELDAGLLDLGIQRRWGTDHGIGSDDLCASARDIIAAKQHSGRAR